MGGRKKNKVEKTAPKKRVPIKFDCEFCGDEKTVSIKITREKGKRSATIQCRMCKKSWVYPFVKMIDQPIDIYIKGLEYLKNKEKAGKYDDEFDEDNEYGNKVDEQSLQSQEYNDINLDDDI